MGGVGGSSCGVLEVLDGLWMTGFYLTGRVYVYTCVYLHMCHGNVYDVYLRIYMYPWMVDVFVWMCGLWMYECMAVCIYVCMDLCS